MKYIAGIDIGTTGAKCGIFDLCGNMVSSGYREYGCEYPQPNWVEQDVLMITKNAFDAINEAIGRASIDSNEIYSISLSTQRTCSIFLDVEGNPLKMISWQDNRTSEEVADIAKVIEPAEYYKITGLPLNTTWVLTKILWMRKNCPDIWEKTARIVQLQDYILKQLGAEDYFIDIPDAVLSGMWDTDNSIWSEIIINNFNIDRKMLPVPVQCGTRIGTITRAAADRTGFCEGTPICVGAGDQNAAAVGAGIIHEGIASVSIGTGGMAIILLNHPYRDPEMKACIGSHAIFGKWQFEGYQIGAAGVFRWFRDEIAALEKKESEKSGLDVFVKLDQMIYETKPGADGLVFLPFLASAAAPRWNPNARGTLLGLTFAHNRNHLARSVMEGITLEQKDILHSMVKTGNSIDKIRIIGGAAKSEIWCQMQADIYDREVETLQISDTALIGAAIFAGIGTGLFSNIQEGVEKMVKPKKIYTPDKANAVLYEKIYMIYCRAYDGLNTEGVFDLLAAFQTEHYR